MMGLNLPSPKKVNVPLLVLGAESDFMFSRGEIEATARAYKTQAEFFPNMAQGWPSLGWTCSMRPGMP